VLPVLGAIIIHDNTPLFNEASSLSHNSQKQRDAQIMPSKPPKKLAIGAYV